MTVLIMHDLDNNELQFRFCTCNDYNKIFNCL